MVMTDRSAEDHAPTRRPSDVVAIAIVTLIALDQGSLVSDARAFSIRAAASSAIG